jgi:membrane protein YqaA with SNARE-associated domain
LLMKTLLAIVTNKYLLTVAVVLGGLFGLSFLVGGALRDYLRYFTYVSICSNVIPVPSTPAVLWMGREYNPLLVAFLGAVGTCLANMIDYEVLGTVVRSRLLKKVRESRHYKASVNAFNKVGFPLLTLVNFGYFSFDIVRLIAIAAGYARWKYVVSTFVGRFARYLILAYVGEFFHIPIWAIALVTLALMVPAAISWARDKSRKSTPPENVSNETEESGEHNDDL